MAMRLIYGGYAHADDSVSITHFHRDLIYGETGWPDRLRITASFRSKLYGSASSLQSQMGLMLTAYSVGGQNLQMLDTLSGGTVWTMDNASAIGGVQVMRQPSFDRIEGAEGRTYLYTHFSLQADYRVNNGNKYLKFQESLSFTNCDGGPLQIARVPAVGPPILQNITERSLYFATQSGEAWSSIPGPIPMNPLWPAYQRRQDGANHTTYLPVEAIRGVGFRYGIAWSFSFVADVPLVGFPNVF